jgi:Zn finger protein HypA/HybF involved in hydrogenase expression
MPGRCDDQVEEREHFLKCPTCGHMIDVRDLAEVLEHAGPHEAPGKC